MTSRYPTRAAETPVSRAVVEGRPETVGELRFAVLAEGARSVADLRDRRTRFGLVSGERAAAGAIAEKILAHGA